MSVSHSKFWFSIDYQKLVNKSVVIGVWDDHDYGANNADASFVKKHIHRKVFLDFIGEPQDSIRRMETNRGIYQDYVLNH